MEIKIKITEPHDNFIFIIHTIYTAFILLSLSAFEIIPSWVFWLWVAAYFPIYGLSKLRVSVKN